MNPLDVRQEPAPQTTEHEIPAFTKEEEERKREAYLMKHPALRWKIINETITWAEANRVPHLRRNRPRRPHQRDGEPF